MKLNFYYLLQLMKLNGWTAFAADLHEIERVLWIMKLNVLIWPVNAKLVKLNYSFWRLNADSKEHLTLKWNVKINRFLLKLAEETYTTTFVIASTMSTFSETYWCNIVTVKLFENITPNSPIKAHRLNNTHCTSLVSFKKCLLFLFYKVL